MARDITIAEMAITLGINRDAYSAKEKGKFSFSDYEMQVIKKKLGLPIEYLFFID
ncbi:helix-turn-helix transcriptional regulator [Bacillus cereus]